jgi:hypothetical protein
MQTQMKGGHIMKMVAWLKLKLKHLITSTNWKPLLSKWLFPSDYGGK